jgi:hypothetical protein
VRASACVGLITSSVLEMAAMCTFTVFFAIPDSGRFLVGAAQDAEHVHLSIGELRGLQRRHDRLRGQGFRYPEGDDLSGQAQDFLGGRSLDHPIPAKTAAAAPPVRHGNHRLAGPAVAYAIGPGSFSGPTLDQAQCFQ